MISAKRCAWSIAALLLSLGWLLWTVGLSAAQSRALLEAGKRYGPTKPGGYYVRVAPRALTMAHSQRPDITVAVETATGQPVEDVLVTFMPAEGTVTTESSRTRGGTVVGTFIAASGSSQPHTVSLVASVEDIDITIFIDIVPAVVGR
jgi:hypothetical protein